MKSAKIFSWFQLQLRSDAFNGFDLCKRQVLLKLDVWHLFIVFYLEMWKGNQYLIQILRLAQLMRQVHENFATSNSRDKFLRAASVKRACHKDKISFVP